MNKIQQKVICGLDKHGTWWDQSLHSPDDCPCNTCPYKGKHCSLILANDALHLLKAQELPPVKPEKLEERTTKWLDNMTAKERLEEIAAICDDWDGYRTAKGLGELINEIWAYALYPVKEQESFQPFRSGGYHPDWCCGNCKYPGLYGRMKFCPECGKAVKWDG